MSTRSIGSTDSGCRNAASSAARTAVGLPATRSPSFATGTAVPVAVSASASVASASVAGSVSGPPPPGSDADFLAQDLMVVILGDPNVIEDGSEGSKSSAKVAEPVVGTLLST